jgi:hypothetical protein
VIFRMLHIDQASRRITAVPRGQFTTLAGKVSGRLLGELSFSKIDDIWSKGQQRPMDDL